MNDISTLGQYGLVGVMLALIALTGSAIWILYKVVSNHINHNTMASTEMVKAIERLSTLIDSKI